MSSLEHRWNIMIESYNGAKKSTSLNIKLKFWASYDRQWEALSTRTRDSKQTCTNINLTGAWNLKRTTEALK